MNRTYQLQPISSKTVVQKIIEQITGAISSGRFQLGEKLPSEFELMEELKVSRNSLREAMKIMSATGLVDIRRGDGTYICSQINPGFFDNVIYSMMFESSSDQEIVELRQVLDEAVIKLAMKKITSEEINQLQQYINEMRQCIEEKEYERAGKLDCQFHLYLTECCKNAFLNRIVKGVYEIFAPSIEKNIQLEEVFARADENHQRIVDSLKEKDESKISAVIEQSLSTWKKNIKHKK